MKMIRGYIVKCSALHGVPIVNTPILRFHLTSSALVRGALRKTRLNNAEKHLDSENVHLISNKPTVNFLGVESEEGVITISPKVNSAQQNISIGKLKEKFYRTSFGVIRYDSDNKLQFHGQYGKKSNVIFPRNNNGYSEVSVDLDKGISGHNLAYHNFEGKRLNSSVTSTKTYEDYTNNNADSLNKESSDSYVSVNGQDTSYVDQYYFGNSYNERGNTVENINVSSPPVSEELNFIDLNYFGDPTVSGNKKSCQVQDFSPNTVLDSEVDIKCRDKFLENFKYENTEDEKLSSLISDSKLSVKHDKKGDIFEDTFLNQVKVIDTARRKHESNLNTSKHALTKPFDSKINDVNMKSDADSINVNCNLPLIKKNSRCESSVKFKEQSNITSPDKVDCDNYHPETIGPYVSMKGPKHAKMNSEESVDIADMTAYDFLRDLQKQKTIPEPYIKKERDILNIKVDSKGFRILKNQVDDLSYFTREEVINLLKQNILYSDDNLLILNKPYSLVMHESQTTKFPCLSAFLDDLANEVNQQADNSKLYTIHRLDKETTGCLLLARNELMAQHLKSLFAQRKIVKKYWILTTRVPDPHEGVIDIPIAEGSINSKKRMVLHPEIPKDIAYYNHSKRGKQAVTSYKMLSESGNAALVEATPLTGIKHQIRVHFGFGLCCPILGDHKYSHLDKLAPQKLSSDILQRLHVRQSKVRYIPLHIHAKSIAIPGYFEGRDLYVKAPLPNHMKENLRRLKFKK